MSFETWYLLNILAFRWFTSPLSDFISFSLKENFLNHNEDFKKVLKVFIFLLKIFSIESYWSLLYFLCFLRNGKVSKNLTFWESFNWIPKWRIFKNPYPFFTCLKQKIYDKLNWIAIQKLQSSAWSWNFFQLILWEKFGIFVLHNNT